MDMASESISIIAAGLAIAIVHLLTERQKQREVSRQGATLGPL